MRRISTGQVGDTVLGTLVTEDNVLRPLDSSNNLTLNGNTVEVNEHLEITGDNSVRVYNGSNYVDVNAPSLSSIVNFTLPADTGTTGHVLSTDGSGNLSYVDISFEVANQTADTATYYPLLSTADSGSVTGVSTSSSKLSFQPSSGTLTVDILSSNNVNIDGGNIDGTTIGSNTSANGTFNDLSATSITETSSIVFKDNVQPITGALDAIANLSGVTYNRKDGSTINEAGLIAEEVEKYLPNLVSYKGEQPYGLHYTKITAYLIEAIKELKNKVDTK